MTESVIIPTVNAERSKSTAPEKLPPEQAASGQEQHRKASGMGGFACKNDG